MNTQFQSQYSDQQRAAVIAAHDAGIRPMTRIPAMAAGGELNLHGVPVPSFTVPYATARQWIRAEERRRRARVKVDPDDSLEQLRGRLIDAAALGIQRFEDQATKGHPDWELARQIARAMREIRAIPPREKRRPTVPGQRDAETGEHNGGHTRSGLAGSIIQAARSNAEDETAPEPPTHQQTQAENAGQRTTRPEGTENGKDGAHGTDDRRSVARSKLLSATH